MELFDQNNKFLFLLGLIISFNNYNQTDLFQAVLIIVQCSSKLTGELFDVSDILIMVKTLLLALFIL